MTYLLFGASGFIGAHTVNAIRKNNPDAVIYNLDILPNDHNGKSIFVNCDVRNEISVELPVNRGDIIINLAAVLRTPGHPDHEYFETNIRGAENVCAFAGKFGVETIVFTSTMSVYGASEDLKREDTLPMPYIPYGISKLAAEKIHETWQAENPKRRLIILRPAVVFGKGENGNFTRLYQGIRSRSFFYAGRKDTIKACIYVKDVALFILYLLSNAGAGINLYNCAYAPAFTIEKTVKVMKEKTGLKRYTPTINSRILMLAASLVSFFGGTKLGIHPQRVKKLMISTNICGMKMAASGYKFGFSFEEAIADWFKDNECKYLQ